MMKSKHWTRHFVVLVALTSQVFKPIVSDCVAKRCSVTPFCPPGSTYNACYDSCYYYSNISTSYIKGLTTCMLYGAHLFVPNSQSEFDDILTLAGKDHGWYVGLQDYARRGFGTFTPSNNWTPARPASDPAAQASSDPDQIWHWLDDSGTEGPAFDMSYIGLSPYYYDSATPWLQWATATAPPDYAVTVDFSYTASSWQLSAGARFNTSHHFICEYSQACRSCPSISGVNFTKFLDQCYYFDTTKNVTYAAASTACNSAVPGGSLWSLKTEAQLVFARIISNNYNLNFWLGLDRLKNGTWMWASDSSSPSPSDPFDILPGEPSSVGTAFRISPDNVSKPYAVNDGFRGWSGVDASSSLNAVACQISSTQLYTTADATTSSSSNITYTTNAAVSTLPTTTGTSTKTPSTASTATTPTTTANNSISADDSSWKVNLPSSSGIELVILGACLPLSLLLAAALLAAMIIHERMNKDKMAKKIEPQPRGFSHPFQKMSGLESGLVRPNSPADLLGQLKPMPTNHHMTNPSGRKASVYEDIYNREKMYMPEAANGGHIHPLSAAPTESRLWYMDGPKF